MRSINDSRDDRGYSGPLRFQSPGDAGYDAARPRVAHRDSSVSVAIVQRGPWKAKPCQVSAVDLFS